MTAIARLVPAAGTAGLLAAFALAPDAMAQEKPVLTAVKAAAAPTLERLADDPAWATAPKTEIKAGKGANFGGTGSTTGTLQAVYNGDTFFMLITWKDPTQSYRRFPFVKQADGSWKKLADPNDKGGDAVQYYEDKIALLWNINSSIFGFDRRGCQIACHAGEPGKPFGNKYTEEAGEMGDIWHVKMVRTASVGQVDDQYLDNTRYDSQKAPDAGRKSDPKTAGGYDDIKLVGGKPEVMSRDGKAANAGGTYWVKAADKVPFEDHFKEGDEVASMLVAPFEGDRADIRMASGYKDGQWTVAMTRKLVTNSRFDVQFDNLDGAYMFGIAIFDDAQVRHAYDERPITLKFKKE